MDFLVLYNLLQIVENQFASFNQYFPLGQTEKVDF